MTLADEFAGTDVTANVIQVKPIDVKGTGNPGQSVRGKGTSPQEIFRQCCISSQKKQEN